MEFKNLWQNRSKPTLSFEFFPSRNEKAAQKLDQVIDHLVECNPDFVSVTFGAGGSTREGSFELARKLKNSKGLEVLPYIAAYGLSPSDLKSILDDYSELGVSGVFCVRGDKPDDEDFSPHPGSFTHASDFLAYVRSHYHLFPGAAGYPEGHKEAASLDQDLEFLKLKVDQGAGFIITQFVYDSRLLLNFIERCREIGITVPIITGIMPIYSLKMTENLAAICGASISEEVRQGLAALPADDKNAVLDYGREFALKQCRELLGSHLIDGIHFYTMDRANTVADVVNRLKKEGLLP